MKGLIICLEGRTDLRNEMVNSPDFWSVLQALSTLPETAQAVFEILEGVTGDSAAALTADNYDPVVSLLNDFATAASVGAKAERRRDEAPVKGKAAPKSNKNQEYVCK